MDVLGCVVDEQGLFGLQAFVVEDELEEARVGLFKVFGEGKVRLVEQRVKLLVAEAQLQVPDVEVVMDFVGVAHQEDLIVFLHLLDGFDAFAGDVQQHGVPDGVEALVGHLLLSDEGFHLAAERGGGVDACVELAHDVDKVL